MSPDPDDKCPQYPREVETVFKGFSEFLMATRRETSEHGLEAWPRLKIMIDAFKGRGESKSAIDLLELMALACRESTKAVDMVGDSMCLLANLKFLSCSGLLIARNDVELMKTDEFREAFRNAIDDSVHRANKIADAAVDLHSDLKKHAIIQ